MKMPSINNVLEFKRKEPPAHEEQTVMLGQIDLGARSMPVDFEVRMIEAPAANRYWIVPDEGNYAFAHQHKMFPAGTQPQVIREWVMDSIHQHFPFAEVILA